MARITNKSRQSIDLVIKGKAKDGVPPTVSLAPGESRDVDVVENAAYRGHVKIGALIADAPRTALPASPVPAAAKD